MFKIVSFDTPSTHDQRALVLFQNTFVPFQPGMALDEITPIAKINHNQGEQEKIKIQQKRHQRPQQLSPLVSRQHPIRSSSSMLSLKRETLTQVQAFYSIASFTS